MMKLYCTALLLLFALGASGCTAGPFAADCTNAPCVVIFDDYRPSLAVWDDGVFLMWPIPDREDFCLIGRYSKEAVSNAMQIVAESGFHDLPRLGYVVPDAGWKEMYVRSGSQQSRRAWHEYLNPGFGGNLNTDSEYRRFVSSWQKTVGTIASLSPLEIHRLAELKQISIRRPFRRVNLRMPRDSAWPTREETSNHKVDPIN